MPPSANPKSYSYAREYMDRALMSERGIAIEFQTKDEAIRLRWDCYSARKIASKEAVEAGMAPVYDNLRFMIRQGEACWQLRIEPQALSPVTEMKIIDL